MKSLSVVIPFSGRIEYLNRCLNSINNQSVLPNNIFIILDYVSLENEFKFFFSNISDLISIHSNPFQKGVNFCRNFGASLSNDSHLHFFDEDDYIENNFYYEFFKNPSTNSNFFYDAKVVSNLNLSEIIYIVNKESFVNPKTLFENNVVGTTSSVILNRKNFLSVKGFKLNFSARQDYSLWLELIVRYKFQKIFNSYLIYTLHHKNSKSISNSNLSHHIDANNQIKNLKLKLSSDFNFSYNLRYSDFNDYLYLLKRSTSFHIKFKYFILLLKINPFSKKIFYILPDRLIFILRKLF
jgi:hypothetical protein